MGLWQDLFQLKGLYFFISKNFKRRGMFSHGSWGDFLGNGFLFGAVYKTPAGGLYMVASKDKGIKGKPLAPVRL